MALPKALREKCLDRLEALIAESARILQTTEERRGSVRGRYIPSGEVFDRNPDYKVVDPAKMIEWATKCVNTLVTIIPDSHPNRAAIIKDFTDYGTPGPDNVKYLVGRLAACRDDLRDGFFDDAWSMLEAEIAADYLDQAERLLEDGYYALAAVLGGAVLENALRSACGQQTPPIPTSTPKGKPKTLNVYIDDLKKAGTYKETRAKQLRAWAAIRNHAAHGEFNHFDRNQVAEMLGGIKNFIGASL